MHQGLKVSDRPEQASHPVPVIAVSLPSPLSGSPRSTTTSTGRLDGKAVHDATPSPALTATAESQDTISAGLRPRQSRSTLDLISSTLHGIFGSSLSIASTSSVQSSASAVDLTEGAPAMQSTVGRARSSSGSANTAETFPYPDSGMSLHCKSRPSVDEPSRDVVANVDHESLSYPVKPSDLFDRLSDVQRRQNIDDRLENVYFGSNNIYAPPDRPTAADRHAARSSRQPKADQLGRIAGQTASLVVVGLAVDWVLSNLMSQTAGPPVSGWAPSLFWVLVAVATGSALPAIDSAVRPDGTPPIVSSLSSSSSEKTGVVSSASSSRASTGRSTDGPAVSTEWTVAVRAFGTFLGFLYAMRKLSWPSNIQACATISIINILVWFSLDRSITGFSLNSAMAMLGTAFIMWSDVQLIPPPSAILLIRPPDGDAGLGPGSVAKLESCIWYASVLFCSCIGFGMVGRLSRRWLPSS